MHCCILQRCRLHVPAYEQVVNDMEKFREQSHGIIDNRYGHCLDDVKDKVYTGNLFGKD